jgi:hypothetical protein
MGGVVPGIAGVELLHRCALKGTASAVPKSVNNRVSKTGFVTGHDFSQDYLVYK